MSTPLTATSPAVGNPQPSTAAQGIVLVVLITSCLAVGAIGGMLTASSVATWYPTLLKPAWNPPNAIFGPVWTVLYVMMAVAYWLAWRCRGVERTSSKATGFFAAQLGLNVLWSALFFGLQRPAWALVDIVALLATIALMAAEFRKHSRLAAALLIPYLLWIAFATTLNLAIVWLN